MYRSLLILAATAAFTFAAPISSPANSLVPRAGFSGATLHTVSFARRQEDEDLEMGGTPFGKRQDDDDEDLEMGATPFAKRQDDDEDLEMGATPFGKREDDDDDQDLEMGATPFGKRQDDDEDLEMGGTPFIKRGIYDKVDVEGFQRTRLQQLQPIDV